MQHKLLTLLICSGLGAVQAAELGDVAPRSYIGQPLAADIDLLALTPDELANLQVRLADANVYRGANVAMNPALATVRLQVERRGQKPVLHVTTTQPVAADYVHVYMRLGVPGKQDVRLATVWLQPDPNPAPPPAPATAMTPASAVTSVQTEQTAAQARMARVEAARDVAAKDAVARESAAKEAAAKQVAEEAARQASAAAVRDRSKPAPLPSMHEAETGVPGEVKAAAAARRIAGVWVSADGRPTRAPTSEDAPAVPVGVAQALLPLAPLPLPKGVKRPAAACAPTGMSAKACVALDAHNAELSSKLTELEGKMKALQGALGGAASAAAVTKGAQAVSPAVPGGRTAPTGKGAMPPTSAPGATAAASTLAAASALTPASALVPAKASGTGGAGAAAADHGGAGRGAPAVSATANLSARAEPEAHAAKAAAGEGKGEAAASGGASAGSAASGASAASAASAAASAEAAASAPPPVATKQIRVLPKLKYKKEKPAEPQTNYTLPIAGGIGLLALLGGGLFWWRKKKAGKGPLKIWQGFRKKKVPEAGPEDFVEVNTAA